MEDIMKKLLSIGLFGLLIWAPMAAEILYKPTNLDSSQPVKVLFDIDDVILKHTWRKGILGKSSIMAQAMATHPVAVTRSLAKMALYKMGYKYPMFDELKTLRKQKAVGHQYINLFKKYNENGLAALTQEMMRAKSPIAGTVSIIQKLSKMPGIITLGIASNMSKADFDHFSGHFTAFEPALVHVVDYQSGDSDKKPSKAYFDKVITKVKTQAKNGNGTTIVFVDDKSENIHGFNEAIQADSSVQFDYVGIQFTSPEQLAEDLQTLGINVATPVAAQ